MRCHYRLDDPAQACTLLAALAGVGHARQEPVRRLKRQLLDTFDARLQAADLVLDATHGKSGDVTLTLRTAGAARGETWQAAELPRHGAALTRPRLRARLEGPCEDRALLVRCAAPFDLHRVHWFDALDKRIATLDLEIFRARRDAPAIALLSVRPVRGFERVCARLLRALGQRDLLSELKVDPAIALLDARGDVRPYHAKPPVALTRDMPAASALAALFDAYAGVMWANEQGIIDNLDSEFLHDYRVALRSIRSWHGDLRKVLSKPARARDRVALAALNLVTGRLRDLDVLSAQLPGYLHDSGADPAQTAALSSLVTTARDRARKSLTKYFRSHRYRAFRRDWEALVIDLEHGRQTGKRGDARLKVVVLEALHRRHARVLNFDWARARAEPALLHELRKECKKLRYLLEGFQRLFDTALCRRAIAALKRVQTAMGDTWDLHVHHALLRELTAELPAVDALARTVLPIVIDLEIRLTALEHAHGELVTLAFEQFRAPATQRIYTRLLERP